METLSSVLLLHSPLDKDPPSVRGVSGISISKNWILTHGVALSSIVDKSPAISTFLTNMTEGELTIVPKTLASQLEFRVYRELIFESNGRPKILERTGGVAAAWRCPHLKRTLDDFFRTWEFPKLSEYDRLLRSIFLLVRVDVSNVEILTIKQQLSCLLNHALRNPRRGSFIEIESAPLSNPMFIGSIARGVISNVVGDEDCVIMTDAYASPGGEGGPIYVISLKCERSIICGMVIAPLSWCRKEWVDYTLGVNLAPCLISVLGKNGPRLRSSITNHESANEAADRSVVLVRSGINWGTGILVDKDTGTFLTCSHVISEAQEGEILIVMRTSNSNSRVWAKLVYRTPENQPYDVAVLRVNPQDVDPSLRSIRFSVAPTLLKGEPVISIGFPFSSYIRPTVSSGVVSKSMDCALLTTCCTQSGTSGGPIVSRITGKMLGMVVCTALSSDGTVVYPRISLAVPVTVLSGPLWEYLRTDNPNALQALTCNDAIVRKIWNFYPCVPIHICSKL